MIECPGCGGNLKYDIEVGQMKCGYCQGLYNPYDFDSKKKDAEERKSFEATIYTCPQCGGELLTTSEVEATSFCTFCGASTIMYQKLKNELRPDKIIPFKITKEDCKNAYMKRIRKSLYASNDLKKKECIESFRGIYIPYWSFDVRNKGHIVLDGQTSPKRHGDYVDTDHFKLSGNLDAEYNGIDFDASSSFADEISRKILPFQHEDIVDFTPGYLSGFYADTADVDTSIYKNDAKDFANEASLDQIKSEPKFSKYVLSDKDGGKGRIPADVTSVTRTMYPVWFMSYRNKDRVAYATVNGQTGKVSADIPVEPVKYFVGSGIIALFIFLFLELVVTLKPATLLTISLICTLIVWVVTYIGSAAFKKSKLNDDKGFKYAQELKAAKSSKKKQKKAQETEDVQKAAFNLKKIISIVLFVIGVIVRFINSPNDWISYCMCIILFISYCFMFYDTIMDFNISATWPLPQFAKKGGDDNA